MTYLNALDQLDSNEVISPFSSRCLSQIVKLSNEKLTSNISELNIEIIKIHVEILNCSMSQLDLKVLLSKILNAVNYSLSELFKCSHRFNFVMQN